MASPERNISAVDARLVGLEDEATRLRAEVAALQDEIRWLTAQDEEPPGWLSRGWVRASLVLSAVGMVALVSMPYLVPLDPPGPHADRTPGASTRPAPTPVKAAARDAAPVRGRAPESPEPARRLEPHILSVDAHPGTAPRPQPARARGALQPSDAVVGAPARGESP